MEIKCSIKISGVREKKGAVQRINAMNRKKLQRWQILVQMY